MALQKTIPSSYDVDLNYWNIAVARFEYPARALAVTLNGFPSHAARMAGAAPMLSKTVELDADSFMADATRGQIYDAIKLLPDFAGAADA